ncbi:MAG: isopenicillin N synthase family dioxygenase [Acidimicrobiales bacterium]
MDEILDVDLLAFESGDAASRRAVVDGVMRSLTNGFVFTSHDLSEDLLDEAYGMLAAFFSLPLETKQRWIAPGTHGQTGYTGLLVETAAGADAADWKEMLNWGRTVPLAHPLRTRYPHRYMDHVIPDGDVPGMSDVLLEFHDRIFDLQTRFLRIIAVGLGIDESFFDRITTDGGTLTRAIRYPPMSEVPSDGAEHVWAGAHGDINLITALPRATTRGLQVQVGEAADGDLRWVDALPPAGHVIINTGIMLEHLTNGAIPIGVHRVVADRDQMEERYSVVQFCHPTPWTVLAPLASCVDAEHPQQFAPIEAGDLLDQVLYDINLVEDARK